MPDVAHDEELAERIRELLAPDRPEEKRMFGGLAFMVGGHMAVAASGQGGLIVRIDVDEAERLLAEPGVSELQMGGRGPMTGWVRVDGDVVDDDEALATWVRRGLGRVRSLPPR